MTTILLIMISSLLAEALVTVHLGQQCDFTAQVISWGLVLRQNAFSTWPPLLNVENLSLQGETISERQCPVQKVDQVRTHICPNPMLKQIHNGRGNRL